MPTIRRCAYGLTLLAFALSANGQQVLWYNGDLSQAGLVNGRNYSGFQDWVYEDFIVPSSGWTVTGVFSNNLFAPNTLPATVYWEIRSNVSEGNGGVLIGSGTSNATVTATGRTLSGLTEYTVAVTGLSLVLAPGQYWLAVVPIASSTGGTIPLVSGTVGTNCVGTPCGNDANAFHYGVFQFFPTTWVSANQLDYSLGVMGIGSVASGSLGVVTCAPAPSNPTISRAEGITEAVGDFILICTGVLPHRQASPFRKRQYICR